jgi:hypothetical protein
MEHLPDLSEAKTLPGADDVGVHQHDIRVDSRGVDNLMA